PRTRIGCAIHEKIGGLPPSVSLSPSKGALDASNHHHVAIYFGLSSGGHGFWADGHPDRAERRFLENLGYIGRQGLPRSSPTRRRGHEGGARLASRPRRREEPRYCQPGRILGRRRTRLPLD